MPTFPRASGFPSAPGQSNFPPAPLGGGLGGVGPRSVSFTQQRPGRPMTLDTLLQRRKEAAARQQEALATPQTTIPGGIGQMINAFTSGLAQHRAEQEEQRGHDVIADVFSKMDPATGATPEQMAAIGPYDPELMKQLWMDRATRLQEAAKQEHWTDVPVPQGETGQWQRNTLTGETRKVGGPAGGNITIGTGEKMSEGLVKDTVFYPGALSANMELEDLDTQLTSAVGAAAGGVIGGNYLQTPEYQRAAVAGDAWIRNVLRKESGAVIGEDEMQGYRQNFLPQPGDDAGTITYKRQLRDQRTNDMRYGLEAAAPETLKKIDDEFARRKAAAAERRKAAGGDTTSAPEAPPAPETTAPETGGTTAPAKTAPTVMPDGSTLDLPLGADGEIDYDAINKDPVLLPKVKAASGVK